MEAVAMAVGSELLGTDRLDSNSLFLAEVLARFGVPLRRKVVVGDREAEIESELRRLASEGGLVVVCGGLGPTEDDRTRIAAAQAFGRELREDPALLVALRDRFARWGREMPEVNRRQAQVVSGSELLENREGTAPGLRLEAGEATIFLLPGVPREYRHLIEEHLVPWLGSRCSGKVPVTEVVRISCLPESEVEQRILPLYREVDHDAVTILASPGDIRVRITLEAGQGKEAERLADRVAELVGRAVFARSESASLEGVVGEALRASGSTVATAESCTGGLIAQRLTAVAGSSDYFPGGVVAYSNREKSRLLGLDPELIDRHGAVSEEVARALARGAREGFETRFGIGVTGIAGPGGGSEDKPIGTVHLAVAGPGEGDEHSRQLRLPGDRERIRWLASQVALEMLRRRLLVEGDS